MADGTLTAVPGVAVGHAEVEGGGSGCTVVLGPFRAAAEVAGLATGTRELGTLAPEHLVPRVDALLLTGGSAFGLAAADGVTAWLAERGRGYATPAGPVPIVPAAVIYDLAEGRGRPDAALGRAACEAAGPGPVARGRVGAGAGATVGKLDGPESGVPGGVGSYALLVEGWSVGALVVANSVGVVLDGAGRVVGGGSAPADVADPFTGSGWGADDDDRERGEVEGRGPVAGTNTTLTVVATDAPLSRVDLRRVARMAGTALARRIDPVHTPFDGDVLFTVSTAAEERPLDGGMLTRLGLGARRAVEESITDAVEAGR